MTKAKKADTGAKPNKPAADVHALMWVDQLTAKGGFKLVLKGGHGCLTPAEQALLGQISDDEDTKVQVDIRLNQPALPGTE